MEGVIFGGESRFVFEIHLWVFRFSGWKKYGGPDRYCGRMWLGPFLVEKWGIREGSKKQMYVGEKRLMVKKHETLP